MPSGLGKRLISSALISLRDMIGDRIRVADHGAAESNQVRLRGAKGRSGA